MVPLSYVLTFSALLFCLGLYGALVLRNAVRILMCIELMLNAVNLNIVAFWRYLTPGDMRGQVFVLFIIAVAAAEAAVGLAIILLIAKRRSHIDLDRFTLLKG